MSTVQTAIQPAAATEARPVRRVQLRTLVLIRWIAIAGQAAALLLVQVGLGFDVPLLPPPFAIGASAAMNLFVTLPHGLGARRDDRDAARHLRLAVLPLHFLLPLPGGGR